MDALDQIGVDYETNEAVRDCAGEVLRETNPLVTDEQVQYIVYLLDHVGDFQVMLAIENYMRTWSYEPCEVCGRMDCDINHTEELEEKAMTTEKYTTRTGLSLYRPVMSASEMFEADCTGFCLACGSEAYGVEPDARKYRCESCGEHRVYGYQELLIMGIAQISDGDAE